VLQLGQEKTDEINANKRSAIANLLIQEDWRLPTTIKKALCLEDQLGWGEVGLYELDKFFELNVWETIYPFPGEKLLGCRWVFEKIPGAQKGNPETLCVQYVAKGFN